LKPILLYLLAAIAVIWSSPSNPIKSMNLHQPAQLISSPQNPRIKQLLALRERSERDETGLFLIEGYRELLRAIAAGQQLQALFYCPELFLGSNEPALLAQGAAAGAALYAVEKRPFCKASYRDRPDGLIGIAVQSRLGLADLGRSVESGHSPLFVVAEAIEKPGNLGTILRSSDAVGADGVIVCDRCTDIYNPNVVRASVGTLFTRPVVEASSRETIAWLKSQGVAIVAATPHAEADYSDADLTRPIAIAMGTEQLGLSALWMEQADMQLRIPMCGVADSLNVAMATTVLLYEALRQRRRG
jgi:TrmH family RNA methyltransferase